jgi:hypothetical protein
MPLEGQVTMSGESYSYSFKPEADMERVEEVLLLATMAVEGLHGRSRIQLDASFRCDLKARAAVVDAGTEVGEAIARIFTALLASTIGEPRFRVERICQAA